MNLVRVSFTVYVLCALILSSPMNAMAQTTTSYGPILETLDSQIQNEMEDGTISSLQAGIVVNDSLIWAKGYGDQPELDTAYMIYSITKTFTATAYLQLSEQGLVDLDSDVSDYLSFEVRNPNDPDTVITPRLLLQHRAGMQVFYDFGIEWIDNSLLDWLNIHVGTDYELYQGTRPLLRDIINSTNINDPDLWLASSGTDMVYSQSGFFFLSFLLEKITNQTYYEYIRENILSPLGMDNTGFLVSEFGDSLATPHGTLSNGTIPEYPHFNWYTYGAGSMRSTVLDLSKYLIAHMNGGISGGIRILESSSVDMMHSDELGWVKNNFVRQGHTGRYIGFTGDIRYSQYEGSVYGIILLVNRDAAINPDVDLDFGPSNAAFDSSYATIVSLLFQESLNMVRDTESTPTSTEPPSPSIEWIMIGGGIVVGSMIVIIIVLKKKAMI
ncbi:MAG: serine hydrolase domain-containing protein [Candidatus Thorarchaeota archaeon]